MKHILSPHLLGLLINFLLVLFFSEHLVRLAFQCLQLVVTDFLPLMPWGCLPLTVDTAAKFGSQTQELNISLTAIGLMVKRVYCNGLYCVSHCCYSFRVCYFPCMSVD